MILTQLLDSINPTYVQHSILAPHQEARHAFRTTPTMPDERTFHDTIIRYIQEDRRRTQQRHMSEPTALGEAKEILGPAYQGYPHGDGYTNAIAMGLHGRMHDILDTLANGLATRSLDDHLAYLYTTHVGSQSTNAQRALLQALQQRYSAQLAAHDPILMRFWKLIQPITSVL